MDWNTIISNALRSGISQQAIIFALAAIGLNLHFELLIGQTAG